MSLRSYLNTKTLTLLLVGSCLISGYINVVWWSQRSELHETEASATADLTVEKQLYDDLLAVTAPVMSSNNEIRSVEDELVGIVMAAKSDLPSQMITLTTFTVARPTANSKGAPLASMFAPIPRTNGLKATPIKLAGKYQNLRLLQAYIRGLQKHPVVLTAMTLEKDTFSLTLQLIGK